MDNLTEKQQILLTQLLQSLNKDKPSTVHFEYNIGDIVYLITDEEQKARMVTGINIRPIGNSFILTQGVTETWHYATEICAEKDVLKTML